MTLKYILCDLFGAYITRVMRFEFVFLYHLFGFTNKERKMKKIIIITKKRGLCSPGVSFDPSSPNTGVYVYECIECMSGFHDI